MRAGKLTGSPLYVISHMNNGGAIFADGIEQDILASDWGKELTVEVSEHRLNLVQSYGFANLTKLRNCRLIVNILASLFRGARQSTSAEGKDARRLCPTPADD